MTPDPAVLGPVAGFLFVVMGLVVKRLWDIHIEDDKRERIETTFWRDAFLRTAGHAEKATDLTGKAIDRIGPPDGA